MASWRSKLKREWKQLSKKTGNPDSLISYHTNPIQWVCACPAYLKSRFLICKHLISCCEIPRLELFDTITRQTSPPFWTDVNLIFLPEYRGDRVMGSDPAENEGEEGQSDADSDGDSATSEVSQDEEQQDESLEVRQWKFEEYMKNSWALYEEAKAIGNTNFVEAYMALNQKDDTMLHEVQAQRNRRTIPKTWARFQVAASGWA